MRTKRKTRTRNRIVAACAVLAAAILLPVLASGQGKSKRPQPEPYAIVAGTVFLDSGRSQPGAKVVLSRKQQPEKKLQEQISSPRGEFSFRVPPGPANYLITATLKGFEPASKEVEIVAQEQVHKTLLLSPASNK
ncbi:MAG: carboxypeptidase-like regulatory domain-containing protein [Acidobacteriota bacterium]